MKEAVMQPKKKNSATPSAKSAEKQTMNLGCFVENPDNPSVATDEDIARLAGKLKRVPLGLTAMRIAYVTDREDGECKGKRVVISGNKRLRVLKQAYGENGEVPAEWFADVTAMSESERHEFIVSANVSDGAWDVDKLLAQYDKGDLAELMKADELDALLDGIEETEAEGETDADEVPETPAEPKSERGKMYQLGRHRVMCGDSTKAEDVARLTGGALCDMVFTDPPYNTGMTGETPKGKRLDRPLKKAGWQAGFFEDSFSEAEWEQFMTDFCAMCFNVMRDNSVAYICLDWRREHELVPHIKQHFKLSNIIVWDKMIHGLGSDYKYTYELINVCKKGNPSLDTHQGEREYCDVWHIQRKLGRDEDHATKKPVELCERAIRHASKQDDLVVDLFGGSGSTLLACERLKRRSFLMELEPRYVDVIRRRWAEFVYGEGCDWENLTPEVE